jgi:hypothetical protein
MPTRARHRGRLKRAAFHTSFLFATGAVLLSGAAACIDLSVDPDAVGSIEFPPLPSPSVISGDTLRDTTGVPYPLAAVVYAANGDVLSDRAVTFLSTDTLTHINEGGIVIGDTLTFGSTEFVSRLVASVDGLQSLVRNVAVVPRPDTIVRQGAAVDTIAYSLPAQAADTSMALSVKLSSYRATDTIPVPRFVVTYRLRTLPAHRPVHGYHAGVFHGRRCRSRDHARHHGFRSGDAEAALPHQSGAGGGGFHSGPCGSAARAPIRARITGDLDSMGPA